MKAKERLAADIGPVADIRACDAARTEAEVLAVARKAAGRSAMFMPG